MPDPTFDPAILADRRLPAAAKLLWFVLAAEGAEAFWVAEPAIGRLARRCGLTRGVAERAVERMVAEGFLQREQRDPKRTCIRLVRPDGPEREPVAEPTRGLFDDDPPPKHPRKPRPAATTVARHRPRPADSAPRESPGT